MEAEIEEQLNLRTVVTSGEGAFELSLELNKVFGEEGGDGILVQGRSTGRAQRN